MKEFSIPFKKIEYIHFIVYDEIEYIRFETMLEDLHTIYWELRNEEENPLVEYFSSTDGWSKNGKLDKSNPIPEIEKCFKDTIGKDLLYFEYTK